MDRYYNLHIVLDGKGYLMIEGKHYELSKGQGFLYGPGLRQKYRSDQMAPWHIFWVHFYGHELEFFLEGRGISEPWLFNLAELSPITKRIAELLEAGRTYRIEDELNVASTLYALLVQIQTHSNQLNVPIDRTTDKLRSVANYIRANSSKPLTIEEVSAIAGYNKHYFSRKFGHIFGKSFPDFMLESRMIHAKRLLVSTPLSIKQIALETGFSQSSYFSSCFHRIEGMTPTQFRMIHKANDV
jgi:AraC-like DNA-binding protein